MSVRIAVRTVWECKCRFCGHQWDAKRKPKDCANCKQSGWNGEDHRLLDPYLHTPPGSEIETGAEPPQLPSYSELFGTLKFARAIIHRYVHKYGPCRHEDNRCVCHERRVLSSLELQIEQLNAFMDGRRHRRLKRKRATVSS